MVDAGSACCLLFHEVTLQRKSIWCIPLAPPEWWLCVNTALPELRMVMVMVSRWALKKWSPAWVWLCSYLCVLARLSSVPVSAFANAQYKTQFISQWDQRCLSKISSVCYQDLSRSLIVKYASFPFFLAVSLIWGTDHLPWLSSVHKCLNSVPVESWTSTHLRVVHPVSRCCVLLSMLTSQGCGSLFLHAIHEKLRQ